MPNGEGHTPKLRLVWEDEHAGTPAQKLVLIAQELEVLAAHYDAVRKENQRFERDFADAVQREIRSRLNRIAQNA